MPDRLVSSRLLERAAAAANECSTLEEAVEIVLAEVCASTGWPVGRLYLAADSDPITMVPTAVWHESGSGDAWIRRLRQTAPAGSGVGVARRIGLSGRPEWVTDIGTDPDYLWAGPTGDLGVRAAYGFPVLVGDEVVAVLEFFAPDAEAPDPELVDAMSSVGHQLARMVERSRATTAVRQSEERYRAVTQSVRDGIVTADANGLVVSFNSAAERMFGYGEAEIAGRPVTVLMPERFRADHTTGLARAATTGDRRLSGQTIEVAGLRRDGSEFPLELSIASWATSQGTFFTGVLRDLTERRDAQRERETFERQLAQRTLHDSLTALPNRALLADRLEHALARAGRRGSSVAVLSLDLDRFKVINDGFGHQAGDELLVAVATRLRDVLRPDDTLARIGGDEFAVLCEEVTDPAEAVARAEEVQKALTRPFTLNGRDFTVSAALGVAVALGVSGHPDQLLRDAEVAMEQARRRGHGQHAVYEASMRSDVAERLSVEHDLRLALRDNQLRLLYQPIIDLNSGTLSGVEALVRWQHPTRGLLAPQHFVALAEETGLIVPLGRWVLEQASLQGARWQRQLGPGEQLRVSVNVSARQFQQTHWADEVSQALLVSGFDAGLLVLEITESVLMEDTEKTSQRLTELRALGVRIAIDDFGTGYSSLGYLRRFPIDILKVDKSFIDGVAEGPHESALARAVIKLAATLKMEAVAEGVSSRRQAVTLRRLRCRFAQGYYFARPQPSEAIDDLLARRVVVGEEMNALTEEILEPGRRQPS